MYDWARTGLALVHVGILPCSARQEGSAVRSIPVNVVVSQPGCPGMLMMMVRPCRGNQAEIG